MTRDAWAELGVALGLRRAVSDVGPRQIVVSGETTEMSVAVSHADVIETKDSDALYAIARIARHHKAAQAAGVGT